MLRIRDIGTLFDISDIHSFIINSKDIVFLHQKQEKSHISRPKAANYRCEVCGYELESLKSCLPRKRFCSIACKVKVRHLLKLMFDFFFWFEFLINRNNFVGRPKVIRGIIQWKIILMIMKMYVQEPSVIKLLLFNLLAKEVEKGHPLSLCAKEVGKGLLEGLPSFRFSCLWNSAKQRPNQISLSFRKCVRT